MIIDCFNFKYWKHNKSALRLISVSTEFEFAVQKFDLFVGLRLGNPFRLWIVNNLTWQNWTEHFLNKLYSKADCIQKVSNHILCAI